jgi:acetyl-CoA acetyltransferase family protein
MKERIAIVEGVRTPFCKAWGHLDAVVADDLGAYALKELFSRTAFPLESIDEVIIGNVIQPPHAANIARVIALKAGVPESVPAYTVHRNCASGIESLTTAANKIHAEEADVIVAGGAESMSQAPFLYSRKMQHFMMQLARTKTFFQKLSKIRAFRPAFLAPVVTLELGLSDPVCQLNMGETAEVLARDFGINREAQDSFALQSHQRATTAMEGGIFDQEIFPLLIPPDYHRVQKIDDGIRKKQVLSALAKLKPYFDRVAGTVTAGNASQITDGAAAVLLMKESQAKAWGYKPIGYLSAYAYAGLDGRRMGLGPVYATAKLLGKTGMSLKDFDLIEINEAFAAQVLACQKAFASDDYAQKHLGRSEALGVIDPEILNVNGGAIALGHPVAVSGTRLVITLLKELARRGKNRGLATLCIGGGQGAAVALEVE